MIENKAILLTQKLVRIASSNPGAYEKEIGDFVCRYLILR